MSRARVLRTQFLATVLWLGVAGATRADVVGPPPSSCPTGSEPASCHGGPHCMLSLCPSTGECGGASCQELALCTRMFHCGGRINPNADPSMHLRDDVTGRCGKDGACPAGSTCKRVRVCVKPDSGGCNYAAAAPPAVSFLTGLAVLLGLRRRRRREG